MALGTMGLWIARAAKVLALLAFFVPWVAVSCNGQMLVEASGYQLATGQIDLPDAAVAPEGLGSAWWAVAAALVILAGLVVSFVLHTMRRAGRVMVASSVLALVLVFGGMTHMVGSMRAEVTEKIEEQQGAEGSLERQLAQMLGRAMRVEVDVLHGYWLTLAALGLALAGGVVAGLGRGPEGLSNPAGRGDGA